MKQGSAKLSVFYVQTDAALRKLERDWMGLFERTHCQNVFLSFDWMACWWLNCGNDHALFVVGVRNTAGRLVALAPFYILTSATMGVRQLRFLADEWVGSDYLNILVEKEFEEAAIELIVDASMRRRAEWDYLVLKNCQIGCPIFRRLIRQFTKHDLIHFVLKSSVCPYIRLPTSFTSFQSNLSANVRYNYQRRLAGLQKQGRIEFVTVTREAQVAARLADLIRLHRLRFRQKRQRSAFLHPTVQAFCQDVFKRLARRGWVRLHFLEIDGYPAAGLCNFSAGKHIQFYQSGMDPAWSRLSPGFVLMGLTIENAIRNRYVEFDFLQGAEPYKFLWTKDRREIFTVRLYDRCLKSWVSFVTQRVIRKGASVKNALMERVPGRNFSKKQNAAKVKANRLRKEKVGEQGLEH